MIVATREILKSIDEKAEDLKRKILNAPDEVKITGKAYYVSNDGNDENDGLSPERAWRTTQRVANADELALGDGVFFRRGDVFRKGGIRARAGVTYAAYGEGEKPKLYGWTEDLADPALWERVDAEHHIWKYKKKIPDVGTLVFNEGEKHSYKHIPSYIGGRFVCRENEAKPFVIAEEMTGDLDIYWHFEDMFTTEPSKGEDFPIPVVSDNYGDLYLRCNAGNPGGAFRTVEAVTLKAMFSVGTNSNVRFDNLCIKYNSFGIAAGAAKAVDGLTVTNCEFGWIGGNIQNYSGTDPNYPEGGRGTVTRYGNAIEVYGGCNGFEVSNCYIYQVYDAGITHQVNTCGKGYEMRNVRYRDNLVEYCVYSIEYFLDVNDDGNGKASLMDNIEMSGNILRYSGYGWGQQRHNKHTPAHIKGWSYVNTASNYRIYDNVFDRAAYRMLHLVAQKPESIPEMYNNTYIQFAGNMIGKIGANEKQEPADLYFDENADASIENVFGDRNAKVYVIS